MSHMLNKCIPAHFCRRIFKKAVLNFILRIPTIVRMRWHELTSTLTFDTQHWIAFSHRSETGTSVRSTCSIHSIIPTVILSTGEHTRFVRDSGLCTLTSAPFSYTERHRIGGSDGTETKTGTMGVIESARTLSG